MDQEKDEALRYLAWRYAAVIGIIHFDAIGLAEEEIESDREQWPELCRLVDGTPEFDDDEGATYMAEVSGMPFEDCLRVLVEEWPRPEDESINSY